MADLHDSEHKDSKIPKIRFNNFLKKYSLVIAMCFAAVVLLLPLMFFVSSTLEERIGVVNNTTPTKQEIFYPGAKYAENQLIVKYKNEYTLDEVINLKNTLEALGLVSQEKVFDSELPELKYIYLLTFKDGTDLKNAAETLDSLPEIEAVSANYLVKAQETPNDPGFIYQWDFLKIQMPQAWEITRGSNNVKVAVIDTGIDYRHQDFAGRSVIRGPDLTRCATYQELAGGGIRCLVEKDPDRDPIDDDNRSHGTHVAGIIGAATNNNAGMAGVNWNVQLMAIKTNGGLHGDGYIDDVVEGVRYAVDNGAKVVNMSLTALFPCNHKNAIGYREVFKYAADRGVTVVVAAGNSGKDASRESPASCDGVITVGATDSNDKRWNKSNFGPRVDISAPGVKILSTVEKNQYQEKNGTSMAAPHVAGVAALLLSASPNLTPNQIKDCLVRNADPINTDKPIGPRLNAQKALNDCSKLPTQPPPSPTASSVTVVPTVSVTSTQSSTSVSPKVTSGPVKTYTCREKTGGRSPAGSIQMGNLECVPNN